MFFSKDLIGKVRRGLRKPPSVIIRRIGNEVSTQLERYFIAWGPRMKLRELLARTRAPSLDTLWQKLAQRPYPVQTSAMGIGALNTLCPNAREPILQRADDALKRKVNLLGSGPIQLDLPINWSMDYKTGLDWKPAFFRDIDYNNPERPSDVKMAWEISRLQWCIPLGQAWLLTKDDRYALAVRQLLEEWIEANPYASSVNWACTMEVAMRIFSWTWFFHVFHDAPSWRDSNFRARFLVTLFLHGKFTERHIERSDVNGNHFTADASALVCMGLFWGEGKDAVRWMSSGWKELERELPLQVFQDGVDYEASIAYHRLVSELFLFAARYRQVCGLPVGSSYADRLKAMARFTAAYTKPDGTCPVWGDADDARVLPLGTQSINDHRYLIGLVGLCFSDSELLELASGSREEALWWFGDNAARQLGERAKAILPSVAFQNSGFFVMRSAANEHVFIDCGPVGLAGRGGHGHNDCLSFEAVLDGVPLISDCGAYVYTASYAERNAFRSTAYHNTPQIDGEEINRFIHPDYLWNLKYDAVPVCYNFESDGINSYFCGAHKGYLRLADPVLPIRNMLLNHPQKALFIRDAFVSQNEHRISIPFHLAPDVSVEQTGPLTLKLRSQSKEFLLEWFSEAPYALTIQTGRVSPSYGSVKNITRLRWESEGVLKPIGFLIAPKTMKMQEKNDLMLTYEKKF